MRGYDKKYKKIKEREDKQKKQKVRVKKKVVSRFSTIKTQSIINIVLTSLSIVFAILLLVTGSIIISSYAELGSGETFVEYLGYDESGTYKEFYNSALSYFGDEAILATFIDNVIAICSTAIFIVGVYVLLVSIYCLITEILLLRACKNNYFSKYHFVMSIIAAIVSLLALHIVQMIIFILLAKNVKIARAIVSCQANTNEN